MKNKIYIVGSGIKSGLHFTEETLQVIKCSDIVYIYHHDPLIIRMLNKHNANIIDLLYLAHEHQSQDRSFVYHEIANIVLESARQGKTVSIVFHGHPLFLVSSAEYILNEAPSIPVEVQVLSAVSSFDTIMTELRHDFAYGMQFFDVTTMFVNKWKPNPKIPTLLFQLTSFMQEKLLFKAPAQEKLNELVEYLCDIYPRDHLCILVYVANNALEETEKVSLKLEELPYHPLVNLENRPTLYVPEFSN